MIEFTDQTRIVPLTRAPWFHKRNLTFPELRYLQKQLMMCKHTVVCVKTQIGHNHFSSNGLFFYTPCLAMNHPFYLAQWACSVLEKMISIGLQPKSKQDKHALTSLLIQFYTRRVELTEIGLTIPDMIDQLYSLRKYYNIQPPVTFVLPIPQWS